MGKADPLTDVELEPLEDKTEALTLRSKKTDRAEKKQQRKAKKPKRRDLHLLDLPYELITEVLGYLRPSSLFSLSRVSTAYNALIAEEGTRLAKSIADMRYVCLQKCFRVPVLLANVEPDFYPALQDPNRQELVNAVKKPFQHIQPPDPNLVCTCFTCLLRWNCLCIIVDFAHWQDNLDSGEPIPTMPRGRFPEWNRDLLEAHASIVRKAICNPLWHVRLLEKHLKSTVRAISRHAANKGNKRRRFRMTREDVQSGNDSFLERSGPPTVDIPFMRDNYYMLEAFMPNRGWGEQERWLYAPAEQHDMDVSIIQRWKQYRRPVAGGDLGPISWQRAQ